MITPFKNAVALFGILALGAFAYAAVMFVNAYSQSLDPSATRSFSVFGQGDASGVPDIAQFTLTVLTEGGINLALLQDENAEKMNGVLEYIKSQGVKAEDLRTQQYSIQPRYQYYSCYQQVGPCPPQEIVGYTVSQTASVKVRDFAKIGTLLSGAVEQGANTVSQLSFQVEDSTALENEARGEAIEKAKEKAEAIAEAGGFRLGRLLSIQEGFNSSPMPMMYTAESDGRGGAAPSIEPGTQEAQVSVTLLYEIR